MLELFPDSARIEEGELRVGGVTASSLAERFGTPLVVYCEETLRHRARSFREAVGADGRVFYGTKAFPSVALLRLLREEGVGADVASAGELAFARAAGLTGRELVVHGNNKDVPFLAAAARAAAPVVLDAPDEAPLAAAAGVAQALVRVTLGVDADTHEAIRTGHHGSKFGLPPDQARAVVAEALELGLELIGVHVHVGSQLEDFDAQAETIARLASSRRTRLTVSLTGCAAIAAPCSAAPRIARLIRSSVTSGRAASWTRTTSVRGSITLNAFATESWRRAPPATTRKLQPSPAEIGGAAANSGGSATMTSSTS